MIAGIWAQMLGQILGSFLGCWLALRLCILIGKGK